MNEYHLDDGYTFVAKVGEEAIVMNEDGEFELFMERPDGVAGWSLDIDEVEHEFIRGADRNDLRRLNVQCARSACVSPRAMIRHRQTGQHYCPRCARNIEEANPGIMEYPHFVKS